MRRPRSLRPTGAPAGLAWMAALLAVGPFLPADAATLYVSPEGKNGWSGRLAAPNASRTDGPLPSWDAARDLIRGLRRQGLREPVEVLLREGVYRLASPFVLRPEDSGLPQGPVVYAAFPGERPVISGGIAVRNWKRGAGALWVAQVDLPPGAGVPRQLFVNGSRARRARTPNRGFHLIPGPSSLDARFQLPFPPGLIPPAWAGAGVEAIVLLSWTSIRQPIIKVDAARRIAELAGEAGRWGTILVQEANARFYLENAREALDAEGEWFYDARSSELTYWPRPGEDLAAADAVLSVSPTLVRLEGNPDRGEFVRHVEFREIAFRHTNWILGTTGFNDAPQAAVRVPAAFEADGAAQCGVDQCTFSHLGGYGIAFGRAAQSNRITGNTVFDAGAGGVKLGATTLARDESGRSFENLIADNHIHDIGHVYPGAIGILVLQSSHNRIVHNLIHDTNYTGISVGWTWGYEPNQCRGNQIDFNYLHHIARGALNDLGAIYTLGVQPGATIRNNLIHDVEPYSERGRGIYLDEGSTGILVEDNVAYRVRSAAFHQHYGRENLVRNNIFALNGDFQISRARAEAHRSYTFERNIVFFDSGQLAGGAWNAGTLQFARNLYYDVRGEPLRLGRGTFADWRARGQDADTVVADPRFADPYRGNFALLPGSPARQIGFRPIDTSLAGTRDNAGAARVLRDLEYARAGGRPLLLDLYLPEAAAGRRVPVIVSIHGGGWHGGQKERSPGLHFTRHGYAVASINYRLTGEARFPAQIEDCKAAVRWLRAHAARYGLDPSKFGAWGASAGGHLAALLGTSGGVPELEGSLGNQESSSRVQAVVDYFGPIDVALWYRQKQQEDAGLIGAPVTGNEARLAQANPVTYLDRGDPPVFIAHGQRDTLVPVSQSEFFDKALRVAGVSSTLRLVPGAAHSVVQLELDAEVLAFLDRYLK